MKLLFVTTVYPTIKESFRGIYIQNRAKALINKGVDVRVAFFNETKEKEETIDSFSTIFSYKIRNYKIHKAIKNIDPSFKLFLQDFNPDLIVFFISPLVLESKIVKLNPNYRYGKFFEGRNIYYEHSSKLPIIVQKVLCLKKNATKGK